MRKIIKLHVTVLSILMVVMATAWSMQAISKIKKKLKCTAVELKLKNCKIRKKKLNLHFTKAKILMDNGTWKTVADFPLVSENSEWESTKLTSLGGRTLVEVMIWDDPKGEAEIQRLHWYVLEVKGKKLIPRMNTKLQKRMRKIASVEKPAHYKEKRSRFGLKLKKNGHIHWWADLEKGEF